MKFSIIFVGILDNILRLHHGIELFNFCKGLEQANLLPSPPDLCDLEKNWSIICIGRLTATNWANWVNRNPFFDLFSLGLWVGLGLTVDLEPSHLLHQARHVVQKLLLARIVHLQDTV